MQQVKIVKISTAVVIVYSYGSNGIKDFVVSVDFDEQTVKSVKLNCLPLILFNAIANPYWIGFLRKFLLNLGVTVTLFPPFLRLEFLYEYESLNSMALNPLPKF